MPGGSAWGGPWGAAATFPRRAFHLVVLVVVAASAGCGEVPFRGLWHEMTLRGEMDGTHVRAAFERIGLFPSAMGEPRGILPENDEAGHVTVEPRAAGVLVAKYHVWRLQGAPGDGSGREWRAWVAQACERYEHEARAYLALVSIETGYGVLSDLACTVSDRRDASRSWTVAVGHTPHPAP